MKRTSIVLLAACAVAGPARAEFINSLRDGDWYCNFPSPNCSFDAAVPDLDDTVRIQHTVTNWGQSSNPPGPLLTVIDGLQMAPGAWLGLYEGRSLWTTGASVFEGGRLDGVINGGGFYENQGTLVVTSVAGADIVGVRTTNRGLWQIASGRRLNVTLGGGSSFDNLQGAGGAAVFELQGNGLLAMNGLFRQLGILRKTGSGSAVVTGTYRVELGGVDGGTIDVTAGELLLRDDAASQLNGLIEAYGTRLVAAPGAALRIADGGQYRFMSENNQPVVHGMSGGGRLVLDVGGEFATDPGSGIVAVLEFDPGELEQRGGVIYGTRIRNDGSLSIAAPATINELSNAGSLVVGAGQTLFLQGVLSNLATGTLELGSGSMLTNAFNGVVVNQGLVSKRGPGIGVLQDGSYSLASSGILAVEAGTLERRGGGGGNFAGTLWAAGGATYRHLDASGAPPVTLSADAPALLTGSGTIQTGLIYLNGTIEPGDAGLGTLTLIGGLHMIFGRLRLDVAGQAPAQTDHLVVDFFNDSPVGGTLIARFAPSFDPRAGQRFPLITTPVPPAVLPAPQFEGLHPGFQAHVEYANGAITLVADSNGLNLDALLVDGFEQP